jgi:glycosyltransferase involved in cell wall biosynthesis
MAAEKVAATKTAATKVTPNGKSTARRAPAKVGFSVIVNVLDFGGEIKQVYDALLTGLNKQQRYELIFVDDASSDNTWSELKKIAEADNNVKLIRFRTSFGEAAAFDAGRKQAKGEKIAFFTTRVRINPAHVGQLIDRLDQDCDLVMGWRHPRRDSNLNQKVSHTFNRIIQWLTKLPLQDVNSGVFAAKAEALEELPIYGNLNIFLPLLANRKGYKVRDEKIEQLPGKFRESRYAPEYIQRLLDILTVIFLTNYSKKPLHFLGFVGSLFTLTGLAITAYLFLYRLLQFGPLAGRPLLFFGALFLVVGIQMISIGLIGEMIIFTHAREIKDYTIEEILE